MPERSSKRKTRRDSPVNSLDEPESSSMRTGNAASLSDKDFTELSEKIEKSVSKRIKRRGSRTARDSEDDREPDF